jgi:hypothetical protein
VSSWPDYENKQNETKMKQKQKRATNFFKIISNEN